MRQLKTLVVAALLVVATAVTASAELTGRDIVEKAYNIEQGDDMTSTLTMTLVNKSGQSRVRVIKQFTKDFGDIEKSIMFFQSPADVKNTSFMNWSYDADDKNDDQWIYLPAIKRVKRISSDSKSDYFMGSDFTYDDLGDRKLDADTHKLLKTEKINDVDCYVVESISKDKEFIYSKTITWIRKDNFIGMKKEFYDEDDELLKTLTIKSVESVDGFNIITKSEMKNVQKNHKTVISLEDISINSGVQASKFTERMMTRGM